MLKFEHDRGKSKLRSPCIKGDRTECDHADCGTSKSRSWGDKQDRATMSQIGRDKRDHTAMSDFAPQQV